MQRMQAIILLSIFCMLIIKPAIPFIEYSLRRTYIIEKRCINRDKPELECNGKCHLKEKVESNTSEQDSSDQQLPEARWDPNEYLVAVTHIEGVLFSYSLRPALYINHYDFIPDLSVFHPPMQEIHPDSSLFSCCC